jgi:hypothetical protein
VGIGAHPFLIKTMAEKRKYKLKPGKHAFAPGGPAIHHDGNTSDEEIEYYLDKYPHIETLIIKQRQPKQKTDENLPAAD